MVVLQILIWTLLVISAHGESIKGEENDSGEECKGMIKLISSAGHVKEYKEDQEHMHVKASKVVLKGCECYRLYERKENRGRSYFVNKIGEHNIPLKKVGSLAKVPCSR
eukprot:GFUD01064763.1.p1 GENE.GFUD01064763.1~~GFUD01064763.1.p1  ORF type:complete len:109 (+),score=29.38 GFUD01064763.1:109-435(+)